MKLELKKYQDRAVDFMLSRTKSGLLLDMGLGKTVITLTVIKELIRCGKLKRVLLVAPIRVLYNVWPAEIEKWDELSTITYHNWHESRLPVGQLPNVDIVGINPESALPLFRQKKVFQGAFNALLIDESTLFKNPSSLRFKALKDYLHTFKYRWILTGTPAPNGLEDLWAQIYIIDRGKALGQYISSFRSKFCVPSFDGSGYEVLEIAQPEIYRLISPLVLRMDARDHIDMPELIFNQIAVALDDKSMAIYREMEKKFIVMLESGETIASPNVAVAGGRCRQIANGGLYDQDGNAIHIHDVKADAIKEIVEELNGKSVLIFYEFLHDLERIRKALGDIPNLSEAKNQKQLVDDFNSGKVRLMVGHPQSIGMGLNLQGACYNVVWMSVPWNLGDHDQAIARVCRQGQKSARVVVHYIMAKRTRDYYVLRVLTKKGATQQELLDALKDTSQ